MKQSRAGIHLALIVLAVANTSSAQVPLSGLVACGRCSAPNVSPTATLFGFKVPLSGDTTDILFDDRNAGGIQIGGATVADVVNPIWDLPPSWRDPQVGSDVIFALVIDRGSLAFDSGTIANADFTAVDQQATCSIGGGAAPLVRDIPGGHAVEWNPVIELNRTDLIGGGCTIAGDAARGLVIGYDVYRLDVATFPSPTLRQFLRSGYVGNADVTRLDFTVPDPDGASGSDLDPTDALTLRNPDGLPDTGDEVLVWSDASSGSAAAWYRLQPVIRGDQLYFATNHPPYGTSCVDLDGDGTPESVDIGNDAFVEFIDPSLRGLGLTYGGEIASSLLPGLGVPPTMTMACDGAWIRGGERNCSNGVDDDRDTFFDCDDPDCRFDPTCVPEDCGNGVDDDGDRAVDCADSDCTGDPRCVPEDCGNGVDDDSDLAVDCADSDCALDPRCVENCGNGVDDDGDLAVDCADPDCALDPLCVENCGNGVDDDGDLAIDCADSDCVLDPRCVEDCTNGADDDLDGLADCLDPDCCGDAACTSVPAEVGRLDVAKEGIGASAVVVSWSLPLPPMPGHSSDVLSGCIAHRGPFPAAGCLRQDLGVPWAECIGNDLAGFTLIDARPIDPDITGFYYLVREQATCGVAGSYGTDSLGNPRTQGSSGCTP